MTGKLKILLLEDMAADAELEARELKKSHLEFELKVTDNQKDFEQALDEFIPDIVLSDHLLPGFNSLEALNIIQQKSLDIPFILVTATVSEQFAVDMMNRGAADYILKDRLQRLPRAVENAVEKWRSKKEGEKFLRDVIASEAMLNEAEKIARIGSFNSNLITGEVKWSEESYRIFGYTVGSLIQDNDFYQCIHPDDRQRIIDTITYAKKSRRLVSLDYRLKMPDGEIKHLRTEMLINRNDKGEAVTLSGFHQDVTDRKQNELLWLTLLKAIPDAVINVNAEGEIIFANKKSEEVFGYSAMEMIGQPMQMIVPDYGRGNDGSSLLPGRHEKKVINAIKKDGSLAEVDINLGPVETPKGIMNIAILRDVTVVRKIERQIEANERKFRALIEHNADMTTLLADNGKILYISPSLTKILGYHNAEILERYSGDFIHPEDMEGIAEIIRNANLHRGEAFYSKYRMRHKEGQYRWCEGTITDLLHDPDVQAVVSNFRDITERKNAEREKEKITAELIRQNKDLEQFAYIVSHNLRAPVANIKGLARSMDYTKNEEEKKFIINGIASAVNKLDEIIIDLNQILNDTRVNSERNELVSFENLVESVKISISDLVEKSDTVIETDFSEARDIMTQKTYLFSIFFNLISNSIKYKQETEDPYISIWTTRENGNLVIYFRDNGIGIDMEKYGDQIFGLYKRFHNHIEGKGMGLFMVKTQVETLGGRISIQSGVNKGTRFRIEFES